MIRSTLLLPALRRDWRAGETRVLFFALALAVAALSTVGFFTDRVRQGMALQASELLGADLLLQSHQPIPQALRDAAARLGLDTADTVTFRSMLLAGEQLALSEAKAVSDGYPLRGELRVGEPEQAANGIPAPGEVWLEDKLLRRLGLKTGDTLNLGEAVLTVGPVLRHEPDRGSNLFQLAPRVLLNLADLPRTGLAGEGSRVTYRWLLAGPAESLRLFREALQQAPLRQAQGAEAFEIREAREAAPEMQAALRQAERFLGLAAMVAVILAGAAVAVSARHFARSQADAAAIMRCLGATQGLIVRLYLARLLALAWLAGTVGLALGYGFQLGLAHLLADMSPRGLPLPGYGPVWLGYATALITLIGFALPPVLRIKDVPPLRVLRRDLTHAPPAWWQAGGLALLAIAGLIYGQAGDARLAGLMLGGLAVALALLFLAAWGLIRGLRGLRGRAGGAWRFGLANLSRRSQASAVQLAGFGLGLMALLLLAVVRVDVLDAWQAELPPDTPNQFVLNIQPGERAAFLRALQEAGIQAELSPMLPAPLTHINQQPVNPAAYPEGRAQRLARRAFNLSWSQDLPGHNTLSSGRWWQGPGECSVEVGIAEMLGIKLGDRLTFLAAGQPVTATVTSLRTLQWDSFKVNFFVILSPDMLDTLPATYLTSFYLPPARGEFLLGLAKRFPAITALDVNSLLGQVRGVVERVASAVEYVFLLTLAAGVLVLYAALQASQEERLHEGAVLRTLGASRRQIQAALLAEFLTLGALAGLLAAASASTLGWLLARWVFDLAYTLNPWLWLIGTGGGALGVALFGMLGTRRLLHRPPTDTLRRVSG